MGGRSSEGSVFCSLRYNGRVVTGAPGGRSADVFSPIAGGQISLPGVDHMT